MMRVLLVVIAALCSSTSEAADVSVVLGGWSHHFVSDDSRRTLNQDQETKGIELSTVAWDFQVSHLTDSFGCSSNQGTAAYRWPLFSSSQSFQGGLLLGGIVGHRCSAPPTSQYEGTKLIQIGETTGGAEWLSPPYTNVCETIKGAIRCQLYLMQEEWSSRKTVRWVWGVLPGAYLDLGDRVRLETTLIRSPWTGHHIVLYWQLSVKVFSF